MIFMIKQFIKAWLYYPELVKYINDRLNIDYPTSRFTYSKHCCLTARKMKKSGRWISIYKMKGIERNGQKKSKKGKYGG